MGIVGGIVVLVVVVGIVFAVVRRGGFNFWSSDEMPTVPDTEVVGYNSVSGSGGICEWENPMSVTFASEIWCETLSDFSDAVEGDAKMRE